MFQHAGEKVDSAAHELLFVQVQLHAHAAHVGDAVISHHAGKAPFAAHRRDAFDLALEIGRGSLVQPENLLQRFAAAFHQRKIVQRQVGNEAPQRAAPHRGPERRGGLAEHHHALDGGAALQVEIARFLAEGQLRGQVAVGAGALHRQRVQVERQRPAGKIHQRDVDFAPAVLLRAELAPRGLPEGGLLLAGAVPERVKRLECRGLAGAFIGARDAVDGEHLHAARVPEIRVDDVLVARLIELDRLRRVRKEIDDGRAAQAHRPLPHTGLQRFVALGPLEGGDEEQNLHAVLETSGAQRVHAAQVQEKEPFGKREVLLQDAVCAEGALGVRQHGLVVFEADRFQGVGHQLDGPLAEFGARVAQHDTDAVVAQQLVQRVHQRRLAVQVEAQRIQREAAELHLRPALDAQTQRGDGVGLPQRRVQAVHGRPLGFLDAHRPDVGVRAGAEGAGLAVHRPRIQRGAPGDAEIGGELAFPQVKLGHRHGWNGPRVVRIHHVQQGLRDFREIVVQPEVDARGQQRHRFDEALHVRILAAVRLEQQARRHLGVLFGEFRALLAQERQLPFVIRQQFIAHDRPP